MQWRCSPVGLERPAHTRQVEGSSPSAATKNNVVLGPLVQWLEPPSHKRVVVGSSPTGSTIYGEIPKWLKGSVLKTDRGCKPREGSNPSFSANINFIYRGVEQSGSSSGS